MSTTCTKNATRKNATRKNAAPAVEAPAVEAPAVETPAVEAGPVGFTKTDAGRLASDTRAVLRMAIDANADTGDRRARASTAAKTLAACLLSDCERCADLARVARGTRVAVTVVTRLRGEKTEQTASVPVLDVLRALVFGGPVAGSATLKTK